MSEFQPIQFVDTDAQRIQNELIEAYEQATGKILYPGDPRRIFLLQQIPVLVALKNGINFSANQNLLPFAVGDSLDALGSRIGVERLPAQPALVTMRFTLSVAQSSAITIPAGTRVTPDGVLYFSTTTDLIISAGNTYGDVKAQSLEGGEKFNGFVPGQIGVLVDPLPYIASVVNVDTSTGGSNEEEDNAYRERQRIAPDSFSVAGPSGAYTFFARSANVNIADVSVDSPSPGEVYIHVLMKDGQAPSADELSAVEAAVTADDRRPLTDYVQVFAREVVHYDINLTYYISQERATEVSTIRAAIEDNGGAVDQYEQWQYAKLGRAITPDSLLSRLYAAGAYRVVLTSPIYTEIEINEVSLRNLKSITYGGLV